MFQIRKIFKFEGSHALSSAYSTECTKIHGHSYIVEVFLKSNELNGSGMILDFKLLKEKVQHIFEKWDHQLVVDNKDVRFASTIFEAMYIDFNPTAENMAKFFYEECQGWFPQIAKVRVHETATGWAEYWEEK